MSKTDDELAAQHRRTYRRRWPDDLGEKWQHARSLGYDERDKPVEYTLTREEHAAIEAARDAQDA